MCFRIHLNGSSRWSIYSLSLSLHTRTVSDWVAFKYLIIVDGNWHHWICFPITVELVWTNYTRETASYQHHTEVLNVSFRIKVFHRKYLRKSLRFILTIKNIHITRASQISWCSHCLDAHATCHMFAHLAWPSWVVYYYFCVLAWHIGQVERQVGQPTELQLGPTKSKPK